MSTPIIICLIICGVGMIIFLAFYFSGKNVIIRTLNRIPMKPTSSLRTNELSKVCGKALHVKEPLLAPYTQRKCVFYQIIIQQRVNTGKSSHWKTLIKEERFQNFFVETKGDFVIVKPGDQPQNYICHLVKDRQQSSGTFNDPTPRFESFVTSLQHQSINFVRV